MPDEIRVAALRNNSVHAKRFWLSSIKYLRDNRNRPRSAAEAYHGAPALAELWHAFFSRNRRRHVSPDYRRDVRSSQGRGEWTATFKEPQKPECGEAVPEHYAPVRLINRPAFVLFDKERGVWLATYDAANAFDCLEPPEGWVTSYNAQGYPEQTSYRKEDAQAVWGKDASYFMTARTGLRPVLRSYSRNDYGPFFVNALCEPGHRDDYVGSRSCRR